MPPFFPVSRIDSQVALDGGFIDSNPVSMRASMHDTADVDLGRTLVLLTRRYDKLPQVAGRVYVQPSRPLPVANFDSTAAVGIRLAFEQGRQDALDYLRRTKRGH
ncbi:MAG: patatin [Rhizobacter sp.]|nr:patatin [Rhizobacter sp.]